MGQELVGVPFSLRSTWVEIDDRDQNWEPELARIAAVSATCSAHGAPAMIDVVFDRRMPVRRARATAG